MALSVEDLRKHLNGVPDDAPVLQRLLDAATAHTESILGFKINDAEEFPDGTPADVERAVLMLAADWYSNREASIAGTSMALVPIGVAEILAEHRRYNFG